MMRSKTVAWLGRTALAVALVCGANCVDAMECDFNADNLCDLRDIDLLGYDGLASGEREFDLNDDGVINDADIETWLWLAGTENVGSPYQRTDFDLSGANTLLDWDALSSNLGMPVSSFSRGDFDFSTVVDSIDRDLYLAAGGIVPVPGAIWLLISGVASLVCLGRSRIHAAA